MYVSNPSPFLPLPSFSLSHLISYNSRDEEEKHSLSLLIFLPYSKSAVFSFPSFLFFSFFLSFFFSFFLFTLFLPSHVLNANGLWLDLWLPDIAHRLLPNTHNLPYSCFHSHSPPLVLFFLPLVSSSFPSHTLTFLKPIISYS